MNKFPVLFIALTTGAMLLIPATAGAHSFGQVYTLPVPFWLYAWAAAAALVLSFVVTGIFLTASAGPEVLGAAKTTRTGERWHRLPAALIRTLQGAGLAGLGLCIATGLAGTPSPYANFNMTFFWIIFVLGFSYLTALIGNVYALINPWRVLSDGVSRLFPRFSQGRFAYPEHFAYGPAFALFAAFIWLELLGKSTPFSLAVALSAYTLINLLCVWLIGAAHWFRYGEFFSVFLRLIARIAPVELAKDAGENPLPVFRWRLPFSGALGREAGPPTLILFCLFMLSSTAFDGLHEAKPWVKLFWTMLYQDLFADWFGHNPLAAFPAMKELYLYWQTAWLLLSPFLYLAVYWSTIYLMHRLTARRLAVWRLASRFLHSLLPIVLVYHITHYYTLIQTQGVKIIALASDPFGYGWNLFGTAEWFRGTIVPDTTTVWHAQVALILSGHMISVVLAHLEALRIFPDRKTAMVSQLPMLGLMVLFTVFGLWILSLPFETPAPG